MGLLHGKKPQMPRTEAWEAAREAMNSLPRLPEVNLPDLSALTEGLQLDKIQEALGPEATEALQGALTQASDGLKAQISEPLAQVNQHIGALNRMRDQAEQELSDLTAQLEQAQQLAAQFQEMPAQDGGLPALQQLLALAQAGADKKSGEVPQLDRAIVGAQAKLTAILTAKEQAQMTADQLLQQLTDLQTTLDNITGGASG